MTTSPPPRPAPLFRSDDLARMASPDRLDLGAHLVSPAAWLLLGAALLLIVSIVIGSSVIRVPIKVAAQGLLMPPAGIKDVVSDTAGRVRRISVRVGERVTAGQAIAAIDQPDLQQDIADAEGELHDSGEQLRQIRAFQARTETEQERMRTALRQEQQAKLDFALQRRSWLKQQVETIGKLVDKGVAARPQLMAAQIDLGAAEEDIARTRNLAQQLDVDARKQQTEREREVLDLTLKQASAQRRLRALNQRLGRKDMLLSPYSGVVVELKLNDGEMIERGATLLSLLPDLAAADTAHPERRPQVPLIATLYVGAADGKRIYPGMRGEVVPATVKREEYGFIAGRVLSVAEMPATQEGMQRRLKNQRLVQSLSASGAPFEIIIALDADPATASGFHWSSSRGPAERLSAGSLCSAEVVTHEAPLYQLLVPALRRVFAAAP